MCSKRIEHCAAPQHAAQSGGGHHAGENSFSICSDTSMLTRWAKARSDECHCGPVRAGSIATARTPGRKRAFEFEKFRDLRSIQDCGATGRITEFCAWEGAETWSLVGRSRRGFCLERIR